ncbi:hypothetical protein BS47DRAFT_127031 [Hydnum rufescens UP504]|uniref:non-specific serine/threonine protein kinase n=1 Tax=Hydnum rufescens UP504 TaxID=1448309 RepID=A0A9P6AQG5_9AGAM|nr:hypothetical protein BS47DRAFT_127031 [Hydnum rufescens UP504]
MRGRAHHAPSLSGTVNHRAQLANAYQELGKELASQKIRVVGNYTLGKVIGEGTYGKVRMGTHRLTSTRVAIKQIPKEFSAQLTREIHHHRRLHHPHVTQLYEVIATESSIWLVTELCSGGELFDYLVEKGRLSESESRRLVGQLCLALHYVHSSKAVHRDLKLENVLLDDRCNVKIGDFGFTREYENGRLLETFCGTTGYAAPEMLIGQKYSGPEVDIWSLGIILYALVTGTLPYDDDDEEVMKTKIIAGDFEIPDWLSTNLQDLIRAILQKNPIDRLSIPQILAHTWFSQTEEKPLHSPPFELNFSESPPELNSEGVGPIAEKGNPKKLSSSSDAYIPITPAASESSSSTLDTDTANYASSDIASSSDLTTATTPEKHSSPLPPFQDDRPLSTVETLMHRSWSESTLGKARDGDASSKPPESSTFAAVPEEDSPIPRSPSRSASMKSKASAPPSAYPARTPVRTKRRSVTSNISAPTSPTEPTPLSNIEAPGIPDYAGLIAASAPIMFSTPLERVF